MCCIQNGSNNSCFFRSSSPTTHVARHFSLSPENALEKTDSSPIILKETLIAKKKAPRFSRERSTSQPHVEMRDISKNPKVNEYMIWYINDMVFHIYSNLKYAWNYSLKQSYCFFQGLMDENGQQTHLLLKDDQACIPRISDEDLNIQHFPQKSSSSSKNNELSFDEGPSCPCTNGAIKHKSSIRSQNKSINVDDYKHQPVYEDRNSTCDDDQGDTLLIADLSPACSKVSCAQFVDHCTY